MSRYVVAFIGRKRGAIGIFHRNLVFYTADTPQDAARQWRDEYEPGGPPAELAEIDDAGAAVGAIVNPFDLLE